MTGWIGYLFEEEINNYIMRNLAARIFWTKETKKEKVETSFSKMYLNNMYEESRHTNI